MQIWIHPETIFKRKYDVIIVYINYFNNKSLEVYILDISVSYPPIPIP